MSTVNIPYTATIVSKDDASKTMEVQYASPGLDTITVGVRYPKEGETVDGVIADAAPIEQWKNAQLAFLIPDSGVTINKTFTVSAATTESLIAVKERKKADIDKFRDALLALGFTYNGHTFDSDLSSIVRLIVVLISVSAGNTLPSDFVWRDKSNVDVPTTAADLAGMVGTCVVTANTIFKTAWAKKAEVDAAVTLGQVAAVTWSDPRLSWTA